MPVTLAVTWINNAKEMKLYYNACPRMFVSSLPFICGYRKRYYWWIMWSWKQREKHDERLTDVSSSYNSSCLCSNQEISRYTTLLLLLLLLLQAYTDEGGRTRRGWRGPRGRCVVMLLKIMEETLGVCSYVEWKNSD